LSRGAAGRCLPGGAELVAYVPLLDYDRRVQAHGLLEGRHGVVVSSQFQKESGSKYVGHTVLGIQRDGLILPTRTEHWLIADTILGTKEQHEINTYRNFCPPTPQPPQP